ncbi:hypothetical protein GJAV_G00143360 [Gymnothorax javanicus]|nr:hypothetical protein GJAV_G00143360 [Gymnothorax javanicus]
MSLGKLPSIKSLVSSSQRKRRFRKDLTADMISPPMGDFRHTMHVGRGGDVFGDTSFLSNHGGTGNGGAGAAPDSPAVKTPSLLSRTLRHVRKTPTPQQDCTPDLSTPPPAVSPIIKNAISLPRLDVDAPNGRLQRALFPSPPSSPEGSTSAYGVESGFVTLPRLSRADGSGIFRSEFRRSSVPDDSLFPLLHCDSIASFTVDLGPSLMSEVFGIIDSPDSHHDTIRFLGEGLEQGVEGKTELCSPVDHMTSTGTTLVTGSLLSEDLNMRGFGFHGKDWEEGPSADPPRRAIPDVLIGSTVRAEPTMEAGRFKMAANVLARHYGGEGLSNGKEEAFGKWDGGQFSPDALHFTGHAKRRGPRAFAEEEDEIKV